MWMKWHAVFSLRLGLASSGAAALFKRQFVALMFIPMLLLLLIRIKGEFFLSVVMR